MILVTGGTGFVGSALVPRLVQETAQPVRVLAHRRQPLWPEVQSVSGDVTHPASLGPALRGVDTVIHLVAIIRERPGSTFLGLNYQGTKNVVGAAEAAGATRILLMSALGAGPEEHYPYLYSKWLAEEAVKGSSLTWTVIRSSIVFGERDEFINKLADLVRRRLGAALPQQGSWLAPLGKIGSRVPMVPIAGDGKTVFQPIWVQDVATIILKSLESEETFNHSLEVGGPDHLTYEDMVNIVMNTLRQHPLKIHLPLFLMKPLVGVMERVLPDFPVTRQQLDMLARENATARDAVERTFGFRPAALREKIGYVR